MNKINKIPVKNINIQKITQFQEDSIKFCVARKILFKFLPRIWLKISIK